MKRRTRSGLVAAGSGLAMMTDVGIAFAASGLDLPEGPYIDFCPSTEQIEAHLEQYGFDYKPTVACAEDGVALPDTGAAEASALTAAEVEAQDRAALRAPLAGSTWTVTPGLWRSSIRMVRAAQSSSVPRPRRDSRTLRPRNS